MKRILAFFLAAALVLCLCACGDSSDNDVKNGKTENVAGDDKTSGGTSDGAKVIKTGEVVKVKDTCEFCISSTTITDDVTPKEAGEWSTHYKASQGRVYVDLCIEYTNSSETVKHADQLLNATLLYGNRYGYNGFPVTELADRSDFSYANITAVEKGDKIFLHYLFEVPTELSLGEGELSVLFTMEGTKYSTVVRDGRTGRIAEKNENAVNKRKGEVSLGEVVSIKNKCEFFVEDVKMSREVVPPTAGESFSKYEAADGKIYIDLIFGYKSFETAAASADGVISASLSCGTADAEKVYYGISIIEKNGRSDFAYSNISSVIPLSNEYIHYLFELPENIAEGDGPLTVNFTVCERTYTYKVK